MAQQDPVFPWQQEVILKRDTCVLPLGYRATGSMDPKEWDVP